MAEVKIEERLISGTGLLRYPAVETPTRYSSLLIDVIRQPSVLDLSNKYSPKRQRYATLVFLRGNYVIEEVPLDYPRRRLDWVHDAPGQTLLALKCKHKADLAFYTSLSGSVSPAPVVPSNSISEFPNLSLIWDEVRIVCHVDTALQVRLFIEAYDECGDPYNEKSPPPPPDPLPEVPPGVAIGDISAPYPDDTITVPYPGDSSPASDFPQGSPCEAYDISVTYKLVNRTTGVPEPDVNQSFRASAVLEGFEIVVGASNDTVFFNCQGVNFFGGTPPCTATVEPVQTLVTGSTVSEIIINSITAV